MAKLMYSAIMSLDGYIADQEGKFHWAEPDEEVHTFVNGLEKRVGTCLLGRAMHKIMAAWDDDEWMEGAPAYIHDFARGWRAAEKIVYSRSLEAVSAPRTQLEHEFDSDSVRQLKGSAARHISVGGRSLAAKALEAGLIDECHFFFAPIIIGGKRGFLGTVRLLLKPLEERRFSNGMVYLAHKAT